MEKKTILHADTDGVETPSNVTLEEFIGALFTASIYNLHCRAAILDVALMIAVGMRPDERIEYLELIKHIATDADIAIGIREAFAKGETLDKTYVIPGNTEGMSVPFVGFKISKFKS